MICDVKLGIEDKNANRFACVGVKEVGDGRVSCLNIKEIL